MRTIIAPSIANSRLRHLTFWRAFFWLALACLALYFYEVGSYAAKGTVSIGPLIGLAASTAAMWPLYGFAHQRKINPRWLWRISLVVLGFSLVTSLVFFALLASKGGTSLLFLSVTFAVLLTALQVYALFKYVHRSPHIWQ